MRVWLSFQTEEALSTALRITVCINYKRLLYLMTMYCSISDTTSVTAVC